MDTCNNLNRIPLTLAGLCVLSPLLFFPSDYYSRLKCGLSYLDQANNFVVLYCEADSVHKVIGNLNLTYLARSYIGAKMHFVS